VNGLYVLGGLLVAAGAFYVTTRILLRRELDRDAYRQRTAVRIRAAGWRTHSNVVYLDGAGGYAYAPTKTEHKKKGGGPDEPHLGLVTRKSRAGGTGSSGPSRDPEGGMGA
jgi:hypothetical protein